MKNHQHKIKLFVLLSIVLLSMRISIAQETNCTDRIDNDGDGVIDMFDTDCSPTSLGYVCTNRFYLTRQVTSPGNATVLSSINFVGNDINVIDNKSYPGILLNASFYYNGYLYAFGHTPSSNTLYQLRNNSTTASMTITGLPVSTWNNAVCTENGILYLLQNSAHTLWRVDLKTLHVSSKTITGISDSPGNAVWGDMIIDPNTKELYCWYHPTATSSVKGLYTLDTVAGKFTFMGTNTTNTMGSLFYNSSGQLYGYGSATIGGVQDRFYSINKTTGATTQFGTPDMQVTQTDGCNCLATSMMLPVELVDFNAKARENNTALITWSTASEMDNDYFDVMRSKDAVEWEFVGRVDGKGNSNQLVSYQYIDEFPTENLVYYRLRQVDFDRKYTYSKTVPVRFGDVMAEKKGKIMMYPNPTNSEVFIKMVDSDEPVDMQVYNPFGQNICNIRIDKTEQSLSLASYPIGMYVFIAEDKLFRIFKE